ncbi:MAG: putative cytochrome c-type bioproteinis protein CycH [Alphaproteobacteria bacterium]|nr:MAG: putative cytochrome c-type bioproteinis protein CycH [Caulobacteraceae bacterium]TPW08373.1 MAG: putative cytochrome c-type bioproteinis protein CycH [Alphaproteobacteria bacterium]
MLLWIALVVLALSAVAFLAIPFLRPSVPVVSASSGDVGALSLQLDEIAKEEAAGEMDPASAVDARTEVERRLLDAAQAEAARAKPTPPAVDRVVAIAVAAIVVVGSAVLYAATGQPMPDGPPRIESPAAGLEAMSTPAAALPDVDTMIGRLAERLKANPDDAEGWRMLGWSHFQTQRYREAAEAYARAVALQPRNAGFLSALGEAQAMSAGGQVDAQALATLRKAASIDARDERAQFYLGLARSQGGDATGALDTWLNALRQSRPESEFREQLRGHAVALARDKGVDISARLPAGMSAAPATSGSATPTPADVARIQALPADEQGAMIAGMVERLEQRLAANPKDADGWVRLMRARMVLNQPDRAREALRKSLQVFAGDAAAQQTLRTAATELAVPGQPAR